MATTTARGTKGAVGKAPLTADDRRALLRFMLLMRTTEERALTLYRQGKVPGSFYDGRGQEATAVGPAFALGPRDRAGPDSRFHRHCVEAIARCRPMTSQLPRCAATNSGRLPRPGAAAWHALRPKRFGIGRPPAYRIM